MRKEIRAMFGMKAPAAEIPKAGELWGEKECVCGHPFCVAAMRFRIVAACSSRVWYRMTINDVECPVETDWTAEFTASWERLSQ